MASGVKDIKTRIKAAKNVGKITKAMEMVSISKMKRAVQSVLQSRFYAKESWRIIERLAKQSDGTIVHPLLENHREIKKVCIVLFASDRGLCGTFHARLFEKAILLEESLGGDVECLYVAIGKKAEEFVVKSKRKLVARFTYKGAFPSSEDTMPICKLFTESFKNHEYDHIFLLYTDYGSAIKQEPLAHQLLPFVHYESNGKLGSIELGDVEPHMRSDVKKVKEETSEDFVFEPDRGRVLSQIIPRVLEMQVYHAALESSASEHAARMLSMQNASDAAKDMVESLTLAWNQARQAAITREIAEISAGKAVLE